MKRDLIKLSCESSFLSCEKDTETILKKLFVTSKPYSDILKKLLVINTKDCLDSNRYDDFIQNYDLARLIQEEYVKITPKIKQEEHEEMKSRLVLSFHDFTPNKTNHAFRDCVIAITIVCPADQSELGDYRLRPVKIMGYIDGILDQSKLSGIGTLNFLGADPLTLSEDWIGYVLTYEAIHGSDDRIPPQG